MDIGCITHPENIKSDGQDVTYFSKGTQLPAGEYNVVYVNGGIKAKFYHLDFSGTIGIGTSEFRWYSAVQNSTGSTYAFTGVKSDSSNRMLREPSSLLLWGLWNNDVPFLSQKDLEASRAGTYVHVYQDNPGSIGIRWPAWRDDYEFGSSRPTFCLVKQRE